MKKTKNKPNFKWGYPALALITGTIGVCLLAFNNKSLEALAITIGAIVTLAGIITALNALTKRERGGKFAFSIALAVALLVSGITTMITKTAAMNVIVGIFGLLLILDGGYKFETTAKSKRHRAAGWWIMLLLSVSLIAGGYIAVREMTVEWSGTVYALGALFIIDAIANLLSGFYLGFAQRRDNEIMREQIIAEIRKEEEARLKEEEKARKKREKKAKPFSFFGKKRKSENPEADGQATESSEQDIG